MAYTVDQYNALTEAIASGTMSVEYADKKVTYRSLNEMLRIQADMEAELFPATQPIRRKYVQYTKGLYPTTE